MEDAELSQKLWDVKNLMLLRKGALDEAVRKAREDMQDNKVGTKGCINFSLLPKRFRFFSPQPLVVKDKTQASIRRRIWLCWCLSFSFRIEVPTTPQF